jgi:hypothetical protein
MRKKEKKELPFVFCFFVFIYNETQFLCASVYTQLQQYRTKMARKLLVSTTGTLFFSDTSFILVSDIVTDQKCNGGWYIQDAIVCNQLR